MSDLILHIGSPRTGTTVLQKHLFPKASNSHIVSKKAFEASHLTSDPTKGGRGFNSIEDLRKALTQIVMGETNSLEINQENLSDFMGVKKFKFGEIDADDQVGVVTGLAWTKVGGELLQVESVRVPGKGKISS